MRWWRDERVSRGRLLCLLCELLVSYEMLNLEDWGRIKNKGGFMPNAGKRQAPRNRNRASEGFQNPDPFQPNFKCEPISPYQFRYSSTSWGGMNAIIQAQLERVESALSTLIESIASYNPSIPAANALLAADDDLNKGLKQRMNQTSTSYEILPRHFSTTRTI